MTTRSDYRDLLSTKLTAEGDLNFEIEALDQALDIGLARLYPFMYKKDSVDAAVLVPYGTQGSAEVVAPESDTIYLVEDATERIPLTGWSTRPGKVIGIPTYSTYGDTVNYYFHEAYTWPADEDDDVEWPAKFQSLVLLSAAIEAIEMVLAQRADTNTYFAIQVRQGVSEEELMTLHDAWDRRLVRLREELGMELPAVVA